MSWSLVAFCALCFLVALSGGVFRPGAWYKNLNKPSWQPPDWLFAPVWFVLYGMIAAAGWMVWEAARPDQIVLAMSIYGANLIFNALWSALFFGMRRMDLALVDVSAMWLSIVVMIAVFWPISQIAALMMLPYLVWVSFAAFLNFIVLRLNPDERGGFARSQAS